MANTFRGHSKMDWTVTSPTEDQVKLGALMRIADATELIAKRYAELIDDRDRYKRWYEEEKTAKNRLYLQASALRGQITKLRNAAKKAVVTTEVIGG